MVRRTRDAPGVRADGPSHFLSGFGGPGEHSGVKNGRTRRDSIFPALMDEAVVVVAQIEREKDHHEYSDSY